MTKGQELMNAHYDESTRYKIDKIRSAFAEVTDYVLETCDDCREKSLALTKLEEGCMWAIKGITREKKQETNELPGQMSIDDLEDE